MGEQDMKKLLPLLALGVIATAGAALNSQPASAARAGVDMVDACLYQYQGAYKANVVLVEQHVAGWKCYLNGIKVPEHLMLDTDVRGWCKHKYGGKATAKYDDYYNPYSWYCSY